MNNVINLEKEKDYLVSREIWSQRFAWWPTKTMAGNWTWLRPYMVRVM